MPTPNFNFRLPERDRAALAEMAKLTGAKSAGGFLAEMVAAMCSGDPAKVQEFNAKLIRGAGEQLILKLNAPIEAEAQRANAAKKRRVKPRGRVEVPTVAATGSFRSRMAQAKRAMKARARVRDT